MKILSLSDELHDKILARAPAYELKGLCSAFEFYVTSNEWITKD